MYTTTDLNGNRGRMKSPFLSYGYAQAVPLGARAAWGARGIMDPGPSIGLLPDRQSWCYQAEGDRDRLAQALNVEGVLAAIQQAYKDMVDLGEIDSGEDNEVVLYEDDNVKAVGNSRMSGGYFYLVCWLKGGE